MAVWEVAREIILNGKKLPHGTKMSIKDDRTIDEQNTYDGNIYDEEERKYSFSVEAVVNYLLEDEIRDAVEYVEGGFTSVLRDKNNTFTYTGTYCSSYEYEQEGKKRATLSLEFSAEDMVKTRE